MTLSGKLDNRGPRKYWEELPAARLTRWKEVAALGQFHREVRQAMGLFLPG